MRPAEPQGENRTIIDLKRQVDALNIKIDSVLRILTAAPRAAAPAEAVVPQVSPKADTRSVIQKDSAKEKKKKSKAKKVS